MYVQHFGFSRAPFSDGMAQDDAVFRTRDVEDLDHALRIAFSRKDTVAILSGMSGTGKTTLAADTLKNINTRLAFACISHPPQTANELLELLLTEFGFEPCKKSRVERLQIWRQFLSEMAATDTRVCLLVESADEWPVEFLQSLHSLTAADAAMTPGANIVLTTTHPPERLLTTDQMLGFNQRVRLRHRIAPLSAEETAAYLDFKCEYGEADPDEIFSPGFASKLYELSGGIIRVIDNLVESTLLDAAAAGQRQVTAGDLVQTAERQFGIIQLAPAEVDELLESIPEASPELPAEDQTASASFADDIPTLTDFVGEPEFNLKTTSSR